MRNSLFILSVGILGVISQNTRANNVKFNYAGMQKGAISETCYHNPCSGAKVVAFKQLDKSLESSVIELTLLGYSRDWHSKKKIWNKKPHKVFVTCSINNPTLTMDGQVTQLPINNGLGVPGVLMSDYELYMRACHNTDIDAEKASAKYGYNVEEN